MKPRGVSSEGSQSGSESTASCAECSASSTASRGEFMLSHAARHCASFAARRACHRWDQWSCSAAAA